MIAGITGQAIIPIVAAGVAITTVGVPAGDVLLLQGDVYIRPARTFRDIQVHLIHGAICMVLGGYEIPRII